MTASPLGTGFDEPVWAAQAVFRAAMLTAAGPGSIHEIEPSLRPPEGLDRGLAALALALCDFETPIFLDAHLASLPAIAAFLRFHTGAPITDDPKACAFALIGDAPRMPRLCAFSQGTLEFPDRSTTLLIAVERLDQAGGWRLSGPGIDGESRLAAGPLPSRFGEERAANRALFPRGVDIFFVAGTRLAGLPRSTVVSES